MTDATTAQIVTLIGVILSFIVGSAGLWIGIRNSRKTIFINSVTTSRIRYIQGLRENVAVFCSLVTSYKSYINNPGRISPEKLEDIRQELIKTAHLINLYLNPEDKNWDKKIIQFITAILENAINPGNQNKSDDMAKLMTIIQYLLKFEWEGAKRESQKGNLSKKEKNKLSKKYIRLYEKYKIQNP